MDPVVTASFVISGLSLLVNANTFRLQNKMRARLREAEAARAKRVEWRGEAGPELITIQGKVTPEKIHTELLKLKRQNGGSLGLG